MLFDQLKPLRKHFELRQSILHLVFGYPVNFFTYLAHLLPEYRALLLLSDPNFDAFLVCLLPVTISLFFESLRGKNAPILVDV